MEQQPAPSSPAAPSEPSSSDERSLLTQLQELGQTLPATEIPPQAELAQIVGALVHYSATGNTEPLAPQPTQNEIRAEHERGAEIERLRGRLAEVEAEQQHPAPPTGTDPAPAPAPSPEPPASE